jgi:hypothetical protein
MLGETPCVLNHSSAHHTLWELLHTKKRCDKNSSKPQTRVQNWESTFTISLLNKLSFVGNRFARKSQAKIETFKGTLIIQTKQFDLPQFYPPPLPLNLLKKHKIPRQRKTRSEQSSKTTCQNIILQNNIM